MITSVSESFYEFLNPVPKLHNITEFGLSVLGANGGHLPYIDYIEADISVSQLGNDTYQIPLLVVFDTEYNSRIPVIIGTNVIRLYKDSKHNFNVPDE